MRNTIFSTALAAAVAVLGAAPGAHAANGLGCGLGAFNEPSITGQAVVGSMTGGPYTGTGTVSIRCYVEVNGVEVTATPTGVGPGVASTWGQVQFYASLNDVVEACTDVTTAGGPQTFCFVVTPMTSGTWTFWSFPQPLI